MILSALRLFLALVLYIAVIILGGKVYDAVEAAYEGQQPSP